MRMESCHHLMLIHNSWRSFILSRIFSDNVCKMLVSVSWHFILSIWALRWSHSKLSVGYLTLIWALLMWSQVKVGFMEYRQVLSAVRVCPYDFVVHVIWKLCSRVLVKSRRWLLALRNHVVFHILLKCHSCHDLLLVNSLLIKWDKFKCSFIECLH